MTITEKDQYLAFVLKAYKMYLAGKNPNYISESLGFNIYRDINIVLKEGKEFYESKNFSIADIIVTGPIGKRLIDGKWKTVYISELSDLGIGNISDILEKKDMVVEILLNSPEFQADSAKVHKLLSYRGPTDCEEFKRYILIKYGILNKPMKIWEDHPKFIKRNNTILPPAISSEKSVPIPKEKYTRIDEYGKCENTIACIFFATAIEEGVIDKKSLMRMYNITLPEFDKSLRYGKKILSNKLSVEILSNKYICNALSTIGIKSVKDIKDKNFTKPQFDRLIKALLPCVTKKQEYHNYRHIGYLLGYVYNNNGTDDIIDIVKYLISTSKTYKKYAEEHAKKYCDYFGYEPKMFSPGG